MTAVSEETATGSTLDLTVVDFLTWIVGLLEEPMRPKRAPNMPNKVNNAARRPAAVSGMAVIASLGFDWARSVRRRALAL